MAGGLSPSEVASRAASVKVRRARLDDIPALYACQGGGVW